MSEPKLPVTINKKYPNSKSDSSIKLHQQHHDIIHSIVNLFDTELDAGQDGHVLVSDGTAFVARALRATDIPAVVTNSRTASYTLVVTDAGKTIETNASGENTITVPAASSTPYPVGTVISIRQYGPGTTTIRGALTVTIRSRDGVTSIAGQYAEATLTKRSTDEWLLVGDLA